MSLDQLRAEDICPWTLSVPRSSQFFFAGNCSHLGTNNVQGQIPEYIFQFKWRLLCLLSFKYFSQYTWVFENWGISLDFRPFQLGIFRCVMPLFQLRASSHIWWIIFSYLVHVLLSVIFTGGIISHTVVHHAVSLLVSAAFTDGTVRSSLLQQSNFKPWLQQLVLLAKEVDAYFPMFHSCLSCLVSIPRTR